MSLIKNLIHNLGLYTKDDLTDAGVDAVSQYQRYAGYDECHAAYCRGIEAAKQDYQRHEYVRLTSDQFEVFRKLVTQGNVAVTGQTTELQAGQIIGVNHALNILRDGFVVDVHTAAKPV